VAGFPDRPICPQSFCVFDVATASLSRNQACRSPADETLHTLGDAISYMTRLPKHRELKNAWQHACKLILNRAPVEEITRQLSLALFMDAMLDISAKPAPTRPRAR